MAAMDAMNCAADCPARESGEARVRRASCLTFCLMSAFRLSHRS